LRRAGADRAVQEVAARAIPDADLTKPRDVAALLDALREAGVDQASDCFEARIEDAGGFPDHFLPYGRDLEGQPLEQWTWDDLGFDDS
jgi:hypothetical protein